MGLSYKAIVDGLKDRAMICLPFRQYRHNYMNEKTYILGIETSCDETAAAVVCNGKQICSSVVASQTKLHEKYGGVVPL